MNPIHFVNRFGGPVAWPALGLIGTSHKFDPSLGSSSAALQNNRPFGNQAMS
jgi:hypothetical protein